KTNSPFLDNTIPMPTNRFKKNCFLKLNNHNFQSSKFRVAGGEPCPYCPTLAAWFDKIYLYYDDQSTLEP
ncbi:MAG: hypothetical protein ABUJ92_13070, partial [Desulfobacterales bacterium]